MRTEKTTETIDEYRQQDESWEASTPGPVAHVLQPVVGVAGEHAPSLCLVRQV